MASNAPPGTPAASPCASPACCATATTRPPPRPTPSTTSAGSAPRERGLARPVLHKRTHADLFVLGRPQLREDLALDRQPGGQVDLEAPVHRGLRAAQGGGRAV